MFAPYLLSAAFLSADCHRRNCAAADEQQSQPERNIAVITGLRNASIGVFPGAAFRRLFVYVELRLCRRVFGAGAQNQCVKYIPTHTFVITSYTFQ